MVNIRMFVKIGVILIVKLVISKGNANLWWVSVYWRGFVMWDYPNSTSIEWDFIWQTIWYEKGSYRKLVKLTVMTWWVTLVYSWYKFWKKNGR